MTVPIHDVVIVGGGLSGVAAAIHLVRTAKAPLSIAIVEPGEHLGRGLAYRNPEPEHRLNGPAARHAIYPDALSHFQDWYMAEALDRQDPEACDVSGYYFPRRYDFGTYLDAEVRKHALQNPSGSEITHVVDRAVDLAKKGDAYRISLERGDPVFARVLIVAATPGAASVPHVFSTLPKDSAAFVADPWDTDRLRRIPKSADVLVLGMAQTASDVAALLLKYGHRGPITLLSRRGIRPRKRPPLDDNSYDRADVPENQLHARFLDLDGAVRPASKILQELRREARKAAERNESWVPVMEMLRDLISDRWHTLPLAEKLRFLRHARTWYDVHRFRLPPQVETRLENAHASGQLGFLSASILDATPREGRLDIRLRERGQENVINRTFDVVVNCTGLEDRPGKTTNPFLNALIARGFATRHATGSGFDADVRGNAIDANGISNPSIFIVGPTTYGAFADQQGSIFIVRRILGILPEILKAIARL
jgi:uncharacterized NAD(P)/FAD-binding protein YdhS